ncbi:hypothetical protein HZY91_04310 [Facklamia sp. DSM 111018]|uniref:Protein PsiE n=1 Tax=Facklamia lactis TaxID=2749967 RepID=A0ABS0LRN8_9LACT|nr:hypothetical protein [Facklamia lactis]MBG9980312.1 hypothetical protein [Facklamia lactis]MBG9986115.1 hypothetical protein [Facklamia lactis]
MKTIKGYLESFSRFIEITIAMAIAIGVLVGFIDLIKYYGLMIEADALATYEVFQNFLGYALLLIVGIELIFMLLFHSPKAMLELILFVIARKMLIYSQEVTDLVWGSIAIALIFLTVHFLVEEKNGPFLRSQRIREE